MKVVRSKVIGFCFGVSNTIEHATECLALSKETGRPCYSLGDLIHNKDIVKNFESLGMKSINSPEGNEPGIALIRAHGVPDRVRREYENAGFTVIDSTCPIVAKGADTIRRAAHKGIKTIIIGVEGHAETIGLQGVETEEGVVVPSVSLYSAEDARELIESGSLDPDEEIVVVVQTTFPETLFNEIRAILKSRFIHIRFSNSPCGATLKRKKAAQELAEQTEAVVVVGGRNSENTRGLARAVREQGKPVFLIENAKDLDEELRNELAGYRSIGLCSGSSTPTAIIKSVEEILEWL